MAAYAASSSDPEGTELPVFPSTFTVRYLTSEAAVNSALSGLVEGVVGFDSEFVKRRPTTEEAIIDDMIDLVGGSKKSAFLAWQLIERATRKPYAWDNMGLQVVQIAHRGVVWVINLKEIRAYPKELRRVLTSSRVTKVGVGLLNDVSVVWNDLRSELKGLVDVGMMARLSLADTHPVGGFGNLSMVDCAAEVLGFRVDKTEQTSDWSKPLTPEQIRYAATDAIIALRLYEKLVVDLAFKSSDLDRDISEGWYSFNSRFGEPVRLKRTVLGEEVPWSTKDCPWFFSGRFQGYHFP